MDITDFDNTYKYKFFLPILYVVNWALMFTGPFFFPVPYQVYCFGVILFMGFKGTQSLVWNAIAVYRGYKFLNKAQKLKQSKRQAVLGQNDLDEGALLRTNQQMQAPLTKKELFAFIIPSYKEDPELLGQTLMHLANHSEAKKRYLVYLAMEAHEEGSVEKAKLLIAKYNKYFKMMSYSHHTIRQYEQKGKASNVSWCAQNLEEQEFKKHGIDPNDVFLTVIDADSWVPEIYIAQVQQRIDNQPQFKYKSIFEPAQMYTRNHMQVPITTRAYDISHSGIHFTNLISSFQISFPLSNYTLSFNLIKKIGFWDTCPDAIGQDYHTTQKAFWKTQGDVRTVDLHIPFNQVNVQTGNGYWQDFKARFWQGERHSRGCADVAYNLKMLFTQPFNWRTASIAYHVLQIFVQPAMIPWAVYGQNIAQLTYLFRERPQYLIDQSWFQIIFMLSTIFFIISYSNCCIFFRKASKVLYDIEPYSFWRLFEFPVMFLITVFAITVPTFIIAAFKVMLNKNEYNTAEKKMTHSTPSNPIQNAQQQPTQKL